MVDFYISESGEKYVAMGADNLLNQDTGEVLLGVTVAAPPAPVSGNPIGLLLTLTYP